MTDELEIPTLGGEPIRPLKRLEYERMAELGFFEDEKVELLFGVVVPMAPVDQAHAVSVSRLVKMFNLALGDRATVTCQAPLAAADHSEPEPDIYVRPGHDEWAREHPADAELVIEVSRSSLRRDRDEKSKLYALSNVREYWIVNHIDRVIEVYRDRQPDGSWRNCTVYQPGEAVSPLAFPDVSITVEHVVPPSGS